MPAARSQYQGMAPEVYRLRCSRPMVPACHTPTKPTFCGGIAAGGPACWGVCFTDAIGVAICGCRVGVGVDCSAGSRRSGCQGHQQGVLRPMVPPCHTPTKPTYMRRHRGRRPCMLGGLFHRRDRDRLLRGPSQNGGGIAVLGCRRCWCQGAQQHRRSACTMVPSYHTPMLGGLPYRRMGSWQP